jgi:hypothetical protein
MAAYSFLARYSRNTLATYSIDLKLFFQWCEANGLDPLDDVKRPHIELFGRHLETDRNNRPTTVARRLILLKCFYRIAAADDYIAKSPAEHVRIPHAYRDESRLVLIDRAELSAMLMTARVSTPTDSALIVLMGLLGPPCQRGVLHRHRRHPAHRARATGCSRCSARASSGATAPCRSSQPARSTAPSTAAPKDLCCYARTAAA